MVLFWVPPNIIPLQFKRASFENIAKRTDTLTHNKTSTMTSNHLQ